MTAPLKDLQSCDFADHATGRRDCKRCETGYPQRCACPDGGLIHAEMVKLTGDGYVQLTWCDKCGRPR